MGEHKKNAFSIDLFTLTKSIEQAKNKKSIEGRKDDRDKVREGVREWEETDG